MPPAYVKPYVKRQKKRCGRCRGYLRSGHQGQYAFVATKTPEQQSGLVLHRTRHLFIRQQTAVINSIRAHLAEFGIVASAGRLTRARGRTIRDVGMLPTNFDL
jgi:transposase